METFDYYNPVRMIFGKGRVSEVGAAVAEHGKRVLLVYGRSHLKKTGRYDVITNSLKSAGLSWIDMPGVQPNPRVEFVRNAVQVCKQQNIDFVLGAGGGSVSDTVKAIAFGAKVDFDIWAAYEDFHNLMHGNRVNNPRVPKDTLPFGVIMTKPGTGSGFDYTSVLTNEASREKLMVINKALYAKFVFSDSELPQSLPNDERAYGIADIMTHYCEQYFSMSTDTSVLDRTKEAGLRTVIESGKRVMVTPSDTAAQANLLYCADWACSDQSMSGVRGGWAAHMIEHEITARTDLNHGHGMAIVYPGWMRYVLDTVPSKFAQFAERVWDIPREGRSDRDLGLAGIEKTEAFWRSLGISLTLAECNIAADIIPEVARAAVRFGNIGSMKPLGEDDVRRILESVANR